MRHLVIEKILVIVALVAFVTGCQSTGHISDQSKSLDIDLLWDDNISDDWSALEKTLTLGLAENHLYGISTEGELYKYHAPTGDLIKEIELADLLKLDDIEIVSGIVQGYGVLVFSDDNGILYALNESDMQFRWKANMPSLLLSEALVTPNHVVVHTGDGSVQAYDLDNGKLVWVYKNQHTGISVQGQTSPLYQDGIVVTGFASGRLIALDIDSGREVWSQLLQGSLGRTQLERINDLDGKIKIVDQVVYASNYQGSTGAFLLRTGRPLWQVPVASEKGLDAKGDKVFVTEQSNTLYALSDRTGVTKWQANYWDEEAIVTAPTVYRDHLVVADSKGYVYWLSQLDGQLLKKQKVSSDAISSAPKIRNSLYYFLSQDGDATVYKLAQ